MLMREQWRCCYFAGKCPPESRAGLTGCGKAGWLTGRVTDVTKRENDGQYSEPCSHVFSRQCIIHTHTYTDI